MREALELALDRDAINQVVFNGEFLPGNQWVSPKNPNYVSAFPIPKRDVAKAKALLKEAGVTPPLAVNLTIFSDNLSAQSAQVIQPWPRRPVFDLKIQATDFGTALNLADQAITTTCSTTGAGGPTRTATPTTSSPARRR